MLLKNYIRTKVTKYIRPLLIKNKCEICGETNGLELHHIKPFSELLSECHKKLNIIQKKNKEDYNDVDIDNIVNWMLGVHLKTQCLTLCKNCHIQLHEDNGGFVKCGNGYEQWIENNKIINKIKEDKYIKEVIIPYLNSNIDKRLYKEDRQKLINTIKSHNNKGRLQKSISQLNKYLKKSKIPHTIISKRVKENNILKTIWIVNKTQ